MRESGRKRDFTRSGTKESCKQNATAVMIPAIEHAGGQDRCSFKM
jgi:hypothetical protein